MNIRSASLISLFLVTAVNAAPAQAADNRSRIRFEALTRLGQHKDFVIERLVSYRFPETDLTSHCSGSVCSDLPTDRYDYVLRLTQAGGKHIRGYVIASKPEELVIGDAGVNGSAIDDVGGEFLSGRVLGLPHSSGFAWVKLVSVFVGDAEDAVISSRGAFRVGCPLFGIYELYVIQGDRVLCRQPVDWWPGKPIPSVSIDLRGGDCGTQATAKR
jgi:hypothetical protein